MHSWDCDERTQFFCYRAIDRGCIPLSFVCDGVLHCDMGEDEYNCCKFFMLLLYNEHFDLEPWIGTTLIK